VGYAEELLTEELRRERERRRMGIAERWGLYDGHHPKPLKVKPPKSDQPAVDDNVTPNLLGMFVDKGVSWLMAEPPKFTLEHPDAAGTSSSSVDEGGIDVDPDEQYLDRVWKFNRGKTLLQKLAMNGGVAGHAWLRVVVPEKPALDVLTGEPLMRLINVDPATIDVLWDQDDIERELAFLLEWNVVVSGEQGVRRQTVELDDNGESWTVSDYLSRGKSLTFEHLEDNTWPHPFPPFVGAQNLPRPNEYYGAGDFEGGIDHLNESISRVLSNLARIVRFHAHPKTWASGIGTAELSKVIVDPDGIVGLPHPEAELHNLEMQSDLSGALAVYGKLKSLLHELSHVPDLSTEKMEGIGQMSGLALRILYGPLVELTTKKQGTYGDALEEANRRILAAAGVQEYDPTLDVCVGWADAVPADALEQVTVAEGKNRLGVSKHTLLEELGYDAEQEKDRSSDEAEASMEAMQKTFDGGGFAGTGGSSSDNENGGADNGSADA
jgi:hypothetical protein